MSDEWGDGGDVEPDGEHVPGGEINLGGGLTLRIDRAAFRKFMNSPAVRSAVDRRGAAVAATANDLAEVAGAIYEYVPSAFPGASRARGGVRAANYEGVIDDQIHSTLMKAVAAHTDPKPDREGDL